MNSKQRNVLVGLVVLAGLGMLAVLLLAFAGKVTGMFVRSGLPITLEADRADGLSNGAAILFRGVPVGKIVSIRRSADNEQVFLNSEIDTTPPLPGNVVGLIETQGPLSTGATVVLDLTGDQPSPQPLLANAVIPARYVGSTLVPPEITELANEIREQKIVAHLDQTVLTIRDQATKAGKMLDSMQTLVDDPKMRDEIRSSIADIHQFSANLQTLQANANGTLTDVRTAVDKTSVHIDDLSRSLDTSVRKLGTVLDQFQSTVAKINTGNGSAALLLNDPRLYNSLADTAKELNMTIDDLQRLVQQWEQEGVSLKLH